jgi:16S rRNA (uracil1498-N3)-methyltransferase
MKQCGRSYLPDIRDLSSLDDVLNQRSVADFKYIAHEKRIDGVAPPLPSTTAGCSLIVLIGPEGGFGDEEVAAARARGYAPLYLGERKLRTETAAVVVSGMIGGWR